MNVDAAFTVYVQLAIQCFLLDPATAEASKAEFVRRAGAKCWEDFALVGEQREKVKESFLSAVRGLTMLLSRQQWTVFTGNKS